MQLSFHFAADSCYDYKSLSEANREISYNTPFGSELCDYQLSEGWYPSVGAAGKKNANNACASIQMWYKLVRLVEWCSSYSGRWWGSRKVCFSDRSTGCKYSNDIIVKKSGSCLIYKLFQPPGCESRFCEEDS